MRTAKEQFKTKLCNIIMIYTPNLRSHLEESGLYSYFTELDTFLSKHYGQPPVSVNVQPISIDFMRSHSSFYKDLQSRCLEEKILDKNLIQAFKYIYYLPLKEESLQVLFGTTKNNFIKLLTGFFIFILMSELNNATLLKKSGFSFNPFLQ